VFADIAFHIPTTKSVAFLFQARQVKMF
jgi:hypothetical protein